MKNYSEMSDFEINKLVAISLSKELAPDACQDWGNSGFSEVILICGNCKDYCNNPSDAWPIIVDNRIKLSPKLRVKNYNEYYKTWEASLSGRIYFEDNENPLRAAMIVYLAMRGDE